MLYNDGIFRTFDIALFCTYLPLCIWGLFDFPLFLNLNDKYLPGRVLTSIQPSGYKQCTRYCKQKTDCSYVNFDRLNLICEMMAGPVHESNIIAKQGFYLHTKESGGVCTEAGCPRTSDCYKSKSSTYICLRRCSDPSSLPFPFCLRTFTFSKNWDDANDYCQYTGTRLAVLNTREKFQKYTSTTSAKIWIGGFMNHSSGKWSWSDGTAVETGETWSDVFMSGGGDCVQTATLQLHDAVCSIGKGFACEET